MEIIPIKTPILSKGDDLAGIIAAEGGLQDGDIIVISSKAVASVEGAAIELALLTPNDEAIALSKRSGKSEQHCQAIIEETTRMNGKILYSKSGFSVTELIPDGLKGGRLLITNAGLDRSNVQGGWVVGWPVDPVKSVKMLRSKLRSMLRNNNDDADIAIILTDSCTVPRRLGVTAMALTVSGIDPVVSLQGEPDLFGRELEFTNEAIADQLATAANFLMSNSDQSVPAAIIRNHRLELSDYEGWVDGISEEEDMYHGVI